MAVEACSRSAHGAAGAHSVDACALLERLGGHGRGLGQGLFRRRGWMAALQGIEDVEDTPEGAKMRYLDITDLIDRVKANVEAIHVCKSYYMSHAYREVRLCMCCTLGAYPLLIGIIDTVRRMNSVLQRYS